MISAKYLECFKHTAKDGRNSVTETALTNFLDQQYLKMKVSDISVGSSVTRYKLEADPKSIKYILKENKRFIAFFDNNDLRMFQDGKNICVEVPNKYRCTYGFAECVTSLQELPHNPNALYLSIGEGLDGNNIVYNLVEMPHLLIAGETGSGKSVFIHNLILSLLLQYTADEVNLVLIDPKEVEFGFYRDCPQVREVISSTDRACRKIRDICDEMDNRYVMFAEKACRDIESYNEKSVVKLPRLVVFVEELADLILSQGEDVVDDITRLVVKARACGIHVILSTQRPEANFMSGKLKSNFQCRVAFATADTHNSRVILNMKGAERLKGKGDGLFKTNDGQTLIRFQSALVTEQEIMKAVTLLKEA